MLIASSLAAGANPTFGQHGMALLGGKDGLYAAHLPMFHAPHEYQHILRVRLAPGAAQALAGFKADLVQGHSELGDKTRFAGADIVVEQVLLFRRLSSHPMQASTARYMQLGAGVQRFLVKLVDSRPDFDHIVACCAAPCQAPLSSARYIFTPKT